MTPSGPERFQRGRRKSDGQRQASQGATADALPEQAEVSRPAPAGFIIGRPLPVNMKLTGLLAKAQKRDFQRIADLKRRARG